MYYKGKGVEKDFKQAAKWYQEAADQGDRRAQGRLGLMYLKGWGVKKNVSLAAYWILRSPSSDETIGIDIRSTQFPELSKYIPDVLKNNSEFKDVKNIEIFNAKLTPPDISLVDRLIRLNSNIQRIDIDLDELLHDEPQKSAFDDFVSQLVDTIQTFNTSLINLDFRYEDIDSVELARLDIDSVELARLNQVLAQNQSIVKLREYLQQHPAVGSDELPREVLKLLADELIVQGCKTGQSEQAVKAGLDEFLMSVQAGRLNVPIRQPMQ